MRCSDSLASLSTIIVHSLPSLLMEDVLMVRIIWGRSKSQSSLSLPISIGRSMSPKFQLSFFTTPLAWGGKGWCDCFSCPREYTAQPRVSTQAVLPGLYESARGALSSTKPSLPESWQWSLSTRSVLGGRLSIR